MNVVGAFMWVSVGATALHYWQGYMADHDQLVVVHERTVSKIVIHFTTDVMIHYMNLKKYFVFRLVWCLDRCAFYQGLYM